MPLHSFVGPSHVSAFKTHCNASETHRTACGARVFSWGSPPWFSSGISKSWSSASSARKMVATSSLPLAVTKKNISSVAWKERHGFEPCKPLGGERKMWLLPLRSWLCYKTAGHSRQQLDRGVQHQPLGRGATRSDRKGRGPVRVAPVGKGDKAKPSH